MVIRLPEVAGSIQHNFPAWVVLVVQGELAGPEPVVKMLSVLINGVEGQHIARIHQVQECRVSSVSVAEIEDIDRITILIIYRHVGMLQRLCAGDGVIARSAVQPVCAQPAEDDVIGIG